MFQLTLILGVQYMLGSYSFFNVTPTVQSLQTVLGSAVTTALGLVRTRPLQSLLLVSSFFITPALAEEVSQQFVGFACGQLIVLTEGHGIVGIAQRVGDGLKLLAASAEMKSVAGGDYLPTLPLMIKNADPNFCKQIIESAPSTIKSLLS